MSGRTRQVTVNPRKVHFPQKSIHKTSKDSENQVDHFWRTLAGKSRKSHAVLSLREPAGYCPRSAGTDEDRASRLRPTWSGHLTCLACGCSSSSHHYRHIVDVVIVIFITIISLLFVVITSRAESSRLGHQPKYCLLCITNRNTHQNESTHISTPKFRNTNTILILIGGMTTSPSYTSHHPPYLPGYSQYSLPPSTPTPSKYPHPLFIRRPIAHPTSGWNSLCQFP